MKKNYESLTLELIPMDAADIVTNSDNDGSWIWGDIFT